MPATVRVADLVADARTRIEELTVDEVMAVQGHEDVVIVDIRDIRELKREGRIPGSVHCPRGMLEFWVDPASPYHKSVFSEPKRFILHCAADWRSALATDTVQAMGLSPVAHIVGGFKAWKEAGGPVEDLD